MHDARNARFLKELCKLGYCCPERFFFIQGDVPNAVLARITRVSERTIRFWKRRKMKCGYC